MQTIYVGIDPGKGGAVAELRPDNGVRIYDTPTVNAPSKKGSNRQDYDVQAMVELLQTIQANVPQGEHLHVVMEKSQPMPHIAGAKGAGHGTIAAFSLGEGSGLWRGILASLEISYVRVQASVWKRRLLEGQPKTKEGAYLGASQLYPHAAPLMKGPRGGLLDGRAEALLLAHYGRVFGRLGAASEDT